MRRERGFAAPLTRSAPCAPDFTGRLFPSVFLSLSAFTALPRDVRYHFFRRLSGVFRFAPFFFEEPFLDVASFDRAVGALVRRASLSGRISFAGGASFEPFARFGFAGALLA